jgi:hypothetical protein
MNISRSAAVTASINLTAVPRVRLIKKLAPVLNGFDLTKVKVGDVILVPDAVAAMLIREGWAERVTNGEDIADK